MEKKPHLKLVTEHDGFKEKKPVDTHSSGDLEHVLSERAKIISLFLIMGVIPICAYEWGMHTWSREVGVHIAVGVAALCTLVCASLIYIFGWIDDDSTVQNKR